ncbi:MAG: sugar transferase [Acidimicrobiales bacterium]
MWLKRLVDLVVAATALIALSPVIAVLAVSIRLLDGSPVLFRQLRSGRRGRPFRLYKFRTMRSADSNFDPSTDAVRITRLGRMLRSSSLDELPSLVNVILGDMSLVGPRPLPVEYLDRYSPEQRQRLEMRPGITGLAQVRGRNLLNWEDRFALDVEYVKNHSLRGDLRLLADTVRPVLLRQGVSADGEVTMTEFLGSLPPEGEAPGDAR